LFFMWAGLNAVFVSADLFNLFVALEILTLTAVAMVALEGKAETLAAAMRYLLFALFGSLAYLLGVALLYAAYGTLDMQLLRAADGPVTVTLIAGALMTAGLMAKTALFPLHGWLPRGPCRRPCPGQRHVVGPGGQGLVLPHRQIVVRCPARHRHRGDGADLGGSARAASFSARSWRSARRD
jgi:multicomponent Na+:H+ antiporter subunit D